MGNKNSCIQCTTSANLTACLPFSRNENETIVQCSTCEELLKEIGYIRANLAKKRADENRIKSKFFDMYINLKQELRKENKSIAKRRGSL